MFKRNLYLIMVLTSILLGTPLHYAYAQAASLLPNGQQQFIDLNGAPFAGGHVYFYIPTTTTPKNTWQDPNEITLNTNPVTLDSAGRAVIYGSGQYRQILFDSLGNQIWDQLTSSTGVTQTNQAVLSTGSPNAYVVTYPSSPTTLTVGAYYPFIANFTSTNTTPTENVNTLGAKTITKNGTMPLAAGDICSGMVVVTVYDGTRMQMTNPPCNGVSINAVTSIGPEATNSLTFTPNPITATGTIGISPITNNTFLGNTTGGSAIPVGNSASAILDSIGGTRGSILERGASSWSLITPGTLGFVFTSNGAGADPGYQQLASGLVLLATVNASASSSVSFGSTYITSLYNKYQIEYDSVYSGTAGCFTTLVLQVSTNNGGSWITSGYGGGAASGVSNGLGLIGSTISTFTASTPLQGTIKFSKPSASATPLFYLEGDGWNQSAGAIFSSLGGNNSTTSPINAVRIIDTNLTCNNINGNFHLYGVTGM